MNITSLRRCRPGGRIARIPVTCAALAVLAGCAGVPARPPPVALGSEVALADTVTDGAPWPEVKWWTGYRDSTLDRLIELALASSPTLATAHARFDSARQSVRIAGAAVGAHVDASADADRQHLSENGLFSPRLLGFNSYDQFDLGLQASYSFDWWGRQRATVAAALDEAHAAQADRSAAALTLAGAVADTYFGWQADQSRLGLARRREATVAREGAIVRARIRAELDPGEQIEQATAALAASRERIAALAGSAALREVALAALVGQPRQQLPPLQPRPLPGLSAGVPDDVTLDLIARRADVTAGRWRVEAAQKTREGARADFYPDVSINGLIGLQSLDVAHLLEYGSRVPAITAAVHLPLFDAGRLKGRYGAAQAAVDAAVASYRDAVLTATREVAAGAATRAQLAAQRSQRAAAVAATLALERGAAARARQGVTDPQAELEATDSWLEQSDALLQLDAAALSADIGLQRALGGGYERTPTPR